MSARLHHQVVLGGASLGHEVVGHVGYGVEHLALVVVGLLHGVLQGLALLLDVSHLLLGLFGFVLFALLHE